MSVPALLWSGLSLLLLGLLLTASADPGGTTAGSLLAQGYLAQWCGTIGAGLVLLAAVLSALRHQRELDRRPTTTGRDHYA